MLTVLFISYIDEANDNFASNDTKLFNISENEALPYFIMIFLTFFQANNLTITATESLFKFMNAILFLLGINYAFPSKLQTIKSKISANYASKGIYFIYLFIYFLLILISHYNRYQKIYCL